MRLCCSFFTCFNTQPTEGGWPKNGTPESKFIVFQHTAARRRLGNVQARRIARRSFNTQPPEGGWLRVAMVISPALCFNTQPPEGGWNPDAKRFTADDWFQHTAARRRLGCRFHQVKLFAVVSTHSRPKAAGHVANIMRINDWFQHTAARRRLGEIIVPLCADTAVSTHSRPKAAGRPRPRVRLGMVVSTHSRPKAAGCRPLWQTGSQIGFNTQPPEGGWPQHDG